MQTPETRNINQCTYTPIQPEPKVFVPKQPFLMQGILGAVFDRLDLADFVIKNLTESRDTEAIPLPNLKVMTEAVKTMWKGDMLGTIEILKDLDVQEVIQFAREALQVEKSLLKQAKKDVDDTLVSLEKRSDVSSEEVAKLRNEMRNMRTAILSDVKRMITPLTAKLDHAVADKDEHEEFMTEPILDELVGFEKEEISPISHMQPRITHEIILSELNDRAPVSASLLETIGVFSPAPSTELLPAVILNMLPVLLDKSQQKEKTLEMIIKEMKVEPIGWLHLERLQFTPVGYERGELVYSLPMLPGETVRLSHREWSRTETEFSKLVYTQLETASEEALSEKSELTQSTNTQQQHTSGHNASVTASGGFGPVNISASYSYNCNDSESKSRQSSAKRSQDITKKASSRVKKEHKVSFKVTTTYELEETSFREITNKSEKAIRWDFHRLMKKWRIDLYRYDTRLTYDIVVPEPGSYLLRKYFLLREVQSALSKPLILDFTRDTITGMNYQDLSTKYNITLPEPPPGNAYAYTNKTITITNQEIESGQRNFSDHIELSLPEGYVANKVLYPLQSHTEIASNGKNVIGIDTLPVSNLEKAKVLNSNKIIWHYFYNLRDGIKPGTTFSILIHIEGIGTEELAKHWQTECYELLLDAAKAKHELERERLKQIRDELLEELNREDALMLRKLEKEELMKGVLRWMLGPTFNFYPQSTLDLPDLTMPKDLLGAGKTADETGNIEYYDPNTHSVLEKYYKPTLIYGEILKFLHHAIEWENVNYVLYPYFWTDESRWDFKQSLYHDDYVHRSFLRAGAARVVLTVRRGFEKEFLSLMEGSLYKALDSGHHYMTIADELEAMAKSHYPYTQDANMQKEEYIFTWQNAPGSEEDRLKRYLRQNFYIDWAEDKETKIEKQNGDKTIIVSIDKDIKIGGTKAKVEGMVVITMDEKKGIATLTVTSDKTYDLKVRKEGNNFKVFREQNLVDTWYEFTPTGALDVIDGATLSHNEEEGSGEE